MFTGIVDHKGRVEMIEHGDHCCRLRVSSQFTDPVLGESICVDGICLTVTKSQEDWVEFDVSPETMDLTAAASYQTGAFVNLERSLRPQDRMGGHFVTGHVDGTTQLLSRQEWGEYQCFRFRMPDKALPYLCKKGSVAVNGVSLTLNEVSAEAFEVMLIPHTLERTNLGVLEVGNTVNIEFDYVARIVVHQTQLREGISN